MVSLGWPAPEAWPGDVGREGGHKGAEIQAAIAGSAPDTLILLLPKIC